MLGSWLHSNDSERDPSMANVSLSSISISNTIPTAIAATINRATLEVTNREIIKSDFAHKNNLHVRDLRVVFQAPSSNNRLESAFYATEKVIIVGIEGLQLLFTKEELLIFYPEMAIAKSFISNVQQHLSLSRISDISFNRTDRFNVEAFEIALMTATSHLNSELGEIMGNRTLIGVLGVEFGRVTRMKDIIKQAELFGVKQSLRQIKKRALELVKALGQFVDNDNLQVDSLLCPENQERRLLAMYSRFETEDRGGDHEDSEEDHEDDNEVEEDDLAELIEVEDMVGNYILEVERMASHADTILEMLANKEAEGALQLDIMRNRLMRYNMHVSVASLVVAAVTILTGIFGMNLRFPSVLQTTYAPFLDVVISIAIITPLFTAVISFIGHWRKWIP